MDSEFRFVTDGYSILPYERKGIKFIPCQISRLIPIPIGLVTFCLHTNTIEADFPEKLNHFLTNNRNRTINFTEAAEVRASASQVLIEGVVLSVRRAAHSVRARRRAV
jgi:hypothetical protein